MIIEDIKAFLEFFPEVSPPIFLSAEEVILYSRENKPLSQEYIKALVELNGETNVDEFTEYIPCFRLKKENGFVAIVYYQAGLLKNEYHVLVLSEKGKMIDSKSIAGTFLNDNEMVTYVASIDEDNHIQVVIGSDEGNRAHYDPLNSQTISYDIAPDGKIILSNNPINEE